MMRFNLTFRNIKIKFDAKIKLMIEVNNKIPFKVS